MKKALILALVALAIPTSVALAAKPAKHGAKHPRNVQYVLRGTLSNYSAYDAATPANGSITIVVKSANFHRRALKNLTLTFAVDAKTRVALHHGVTAVTTGDRGVVKIRAAKRILAADLAATLQLSSAKQIADNGVAKAHH